MGMYICILILCVEKKNFLDAYYVNARYAYENHIHM